MIVFYFNDSFAAGWKVVESTVKTSILNCVVSFSLNIERIQIKQLIHISTLQNIISVIQKLNPSANYLCEPMHNKPFV